MYLDQHGSVRACCQNVDHALGNVTEQRLRDIWDGEQTRVLRQAMVDHDLSRGCGFCRWQESEGNDGLVFARTFDHLEVDTAAPVWPRQLELSMSNACNLQCEMCNGDWSSSIRTHREGRLPLPQVYDDAFFDDLRPFLEHIEVVKILGGEPFLGRESLRVMEMLIELGTTAEVHVTTNGTQWSPSVQRILEALPMVIIVSLDGSDKETYEAIRVGADFDVVMRNLDRFQGYAASHGTSVNLAHCLMTDNWQRFPDFLRFAEGRGLSAYVNTVTFPNSLSLFHLPPAHLARIVDAYEAVDDEMGVVLSINRALWSDQLERLRHRLRGLARGEGINYYLGVMGFPFIDADVVAGVDAARRVATELSATEPTHVRIDVDQRVADLVAGPTLVAGVELQELVGRSVESVLEALGRRHGTPSVANPTGPDDDVRHWRLTFADEASPTISVLLAPHRDEEGAILSFDGHFAVEVPTAAPHVAPSTAPGAVDDLVRELRAAHGPVHELLVSTDGHVESVEAQDTPLGAALADASGRPATDLFSVVATTLGAIEDHASEPAGELGTRHQVQVRSEAGTVHTIRALVLSQPATDFGPGRTRIAVAEG